jgi:hypothetical protein
VKTALLRENADRQLGREKHHKQLSQQEHRTEKAALFLETVRTGSGKLRKFIF